MDTVLHECSHWVDAGINISLSPTWNSCGPAGEDDSTANNANSDRDIDELYIVEDERTSKAPVAGLRCTDKDWSFSHGGVYDGFGSNSLGMKYQIIIG